MDQLTGETYPTYVSPEQQAGAAIGTGVALAGGAYEAYNSFSKGGVSGALGGVAAVTGTAALLDPEPVSKAIPQPRQRWRVFSSRSFPTRRPLGRRRSRINFNMTNTLPRPH